MEKEHKRLEHSLEKKDTSHPIMSSNKARNRIIWIALYFFSAIALMVFGHWFFSIITYSSISTFFSDTIDSSFLVYALGGFLAQMIDGSLGMAYGVTVTTFLMSLGIPAITPAVASASMHASEIVSTGTSSLVYMRYKNVNNKLFITLLIPGAIGAIIGAFTISFISKDYIAFVRPLVGCYTLFLGVLIIRKALNLHTKTREKIKRIRPVALAGGFFDSVGGGGWGPIVTTTLIAGGRELKYAVGSSHVAKFFVAIISTATFIAFIGLSHWKIIIGLIVGSVIAAPLSIKISTKISKKWGLIIVGMLVIIISLRIIIFAFLK